ncbi:hypothetical protein BJQ90_02943 [Arthrobacter sp. SO3]|nr:hypothetical protein [Arthrobacter sp. SO3]
MVGADQLGCDVVPGAPARQEKFEFGVAVGVELDALGADPLCAAPFCAGRLGTVGHAAAGGQCGIAQHRGPGPRGHRRDAGVVQVEYGGAGGGQGFDEFALGPGNVLHAAKLAGVGRADAKNNSDVGAHHLREVADVAHARGTHLNHEVTGVGTGLEDGERDPDFAVVGTLRGNGPAFAGQDPGQQVLRGGLAGGAGNADHGQWLAVGRTAGADPADGFGGQCAHREDRVLDDDGGVGSPGAVRDVMLDQCQHCSAFEGRAHEVVAVGRLPRLGHIEGTRCGFPGVGDHGAGDNPRIGGQPAVG